MKNALPFVFIISLILALPACKKETVYTTVYPGNYYPCYPGSWWKYRENDSVINEVRVSEQYELNSYMTGNSEKPWSDPVYVPLVNTQPIYGYDFVRNYRTISTGEVAYQSLYPFLSEKVGTKFSDASYDNTHYGDMSEHGIVKEKYFNGSDSIIVLESHWVYGPYETVIRHKYFTKGVGLTSETMVDTLNNDTLLKRILIDYHIGKR